MAAQPSLVLLLDVAEPAVLAAAKAGLSQFATSLCLQRQQASAFAAATSAANAAAPPLAVLGLCNLAKPPQSLKPVLQVRYRPGPFVLRDFHAAVGRLAHSAPADGAMTGAGVAAALQQLVSMVAQDAACAGAGGRKTVMYLSDHLSYEPEDFAGCLEVCRSKGVSIELLFLVPDADSTQPGCAAADTLTAAWQAAESAFPHLSVTVVRGASSVSFDALGSTLLQRYVPRCQLAVSLTFKQPLLGSIRSLPLSCSAEVQPLTQALDHALLCPCHHAPTSGVGASRAATCAVSGGLLERRQCRLDESTVVVGGHPAGALHLTAPFSLTSLAGGGGGGAAASLTVLTRVKVGDANPALLFGVPLLLAPQQPGQAFKVVAEGGVVNVSTRQLLELVCSSLSSSEEALLACSSTDLESGKAGLFRLHYLLLPCPTTCDQPAALLAKRVASADELPAPVLVAAAQAPAAAAPTPPAVAEAVAGQLALVPLQQLDPLTLSSRSTETVEMLFRESQPMPKVAVPVTPPAAAAPAGLATTAAVPVPTAAVAAPRKGEGPGAVQTGARVKRPAAAAPAPARESGGQQRAASGRKQAAGGAGKGALEFRRSARR